MVGIRSQRALRLRGLAVKGRETRAGLETSGWVGGVKSVCARVVVIVGVWGVRAPRGLRGTIAPAGSVGPEEGTSLARGPSAGREARPAGREGPARGGAPFPSPPPPPPRLPRLMSSDRVSSKGGPPVFTASRH